MDDLIRIAFLEPTYLDEAKELAKQELARRGLNEVDGQQVERVRAELAGYEAALKESDISNANRILDCVSPMRTMGMTDDVVFLAVGAGPC